VLLTNITYGEYKVIDSLELGLYDNILKINRLDSSHYIYERYDKKQDKVTTRRFLESMIGEAVEIYLYPLPAIYTPPPADYAKHVMIKLKESAVVSPKSTLEFYLKMPVEVGVFYKHDRSVMIDVFASKLFKYALYGTSDNGLVCRYYESNMSFDALPIEPFCECLVHVRLSNYLDKPAIVNMLVIPVEGIDLWYDGNTALLDTVTAIIKQGIKNEVIEVKVEESTEYKYTKTRVSPTVVSRTYTMELGF
jgi:hypothetical protein